MISFEFYAMIPFEFRVKSTTSDSGPAFKVRLGFGLRFQCKHLTSKTVNRKENRSMFLSHGDGHVSVPQLAMPLADGEVEHVQLVVYRIEVSR